MKEEKFAPVAVLVFMLFVGFLFSFSNAAASTIYANSSTGNDTTGDGSSGTPYQTFHKAYTAAAASGDTLNLTGTFDWSNSGETGDASGSGYSLAKSLTIQGQGTSTTIIQASSTENTADRRVFTVNSGKTVTIKSLTIRYGVSTATESAGGITNSGTLNIQNALLAYNRYNSTTNYYGAGAIDLPNDANSTLTISTSTIANNSFNGKYYGSGGLFAGQTNTITITASTFRDNHATSSDPATFAYSYADPSGAFGVFRFVTTVVTNSTFTGNTTNSYGGALEVYYPNSFKVTNSTIANNYAYYGAGGIMFESVTNGYNLHLENTILANNTGSTSANDFYTVDANSAGRVTDNGYNIVESSTNKTWSGTGDITGDQASLNLDVIPAYNSATNGIETLALSSGSVAINAGTSSANSSIAVPSFDARGATRTSATDIGAYEYGGGGLADAVVPTVSLSAPASAAVVSGSSVALSGTASDNVGVAGVKFYVDSVLQGSEDTSSPYSINWDSTGTTSGSHSVVAVARDTSNNLATSTAVSFTVDNTAPSASVTLPLSGASVATTTTLSASASDVHSSVSGVSFYVNGTLVGSEDTSSPYSISWDTTATSSGARTVVAVARDAVGNIATSSSVAFTIDNATPVLSSLAATGASSGATITWTSDALTSSVVNFGLTTSYGSSTVEGDTSPRVTSHSVVIAGLPTCTIYHYQTQGRNAATTLATSSDSTFTTSGCTGSASIATTTQGSITTALGGTVTQGILTLTVPTSFTSTSSSATFQADQLDDVSFFTTAGVPSGKSKVGSTVFHLKALIDATTTLAVFSSSLSVTLSYTPSNISGLVETSLKIYRYDGASWFALSSCSVNTSLRTVTCQTSNFSDFSLFGDTQPASSSGSSVAGGIVPVSILQQQFVTALKLSASKASSLSAGSATGTVKENMPSLLGTQGTSSYQFLRTLRAGSTGEEVRGLQEFLNTHGFIVSERGSGSPGNESIYFGTRTYNALVKFQEAHMNDILSPQGLTRGSGILGERTRRFMNATFAK